MTKLYLILFLTLFFTTCKVATQERKNVDTVLYFDMNADILNNEQVIIVDSIGAYLKKHPKVKINIVGLAHPKEVKYKKGPEGIALKRCQNIGNYFTHHFEISSERISYTEEIIGPNLGENPQEFKGPAEAEYRKVYFIIDNQITTAK